MTLAVVTDVPKDPGGVGVLGSGGQPVLTHQAARRRHEPWETHTIQGIVHAP
jgi:hypothetical protein